MDKRKSIVIAEAAGSAVIAAVFSVYLITGKDRLLGDAINIAVFAVLLICAELLYNFTLRALFVKNKRIHIVFIFCASILSLLYGVMFPAGSVEDETMHISNTFLLSNRLMGIDARVSNDQTEDPTVYYDYRTKKYAVHDSNRGSEVYIFYDTYIESDTAEKWQVYVSQSPDSGRTKAALSSLISDPLCSSEKTSIRLKDHNVSVVSYLPAVIGVTLARIFGLSFGYQLMLGSSLMAAFYIACSAFAIWRIPKGKHAVYVAALLPMSLYFSCSFNYDSVILGLCFALFAQTMHFVFSEETRLHVKDVIMLLVLTLLLAGLKFGSYIFIILLLVLTPKEKYGKRKKRALIACAALAAAIGLVIVNIESISSVMNSMSSGLKGNSGKTNYSISYIFREPAETLKVMFRTVCKNVVANWIPSSLGINMNWLRIRIDRWIIGGVGLMALLSAVNSSGFPMAKNSIGKRLLMLLPLLICALFFLVGMFIWETEASSDTITGIQGRYFTPLIPCAITAVSGIDIKKIKWKSEYVIPPLAAFDVFALLSAFSIIIAK